MNFLRQQADAFLSHLQEEEVEVSSEPQTPKVVLPQDPEMEAAIDEMKEKLENLRVRGMLQRIKNAKEIEKLQAQQQTANEHLKNNVETLVQRAHTAPYVEATKQVNQDFIRTGVVVTLQAQLCLHVHGLCMHQEQLALLKRHNSDVLFWYEDMVKQLRRDQADQELQLMNELVSTKMGLGELVDAKKLRERRERRESQSAHSFFRQSNNSTNGGLKQARTSMRRRRSSLMTGTTLPPQVQLLPINAGTRHRTVRQISTRGTALGSRKRGSMMRASLLRKNSSLRNLTTNDSVRDDSSKSRSMSPSMKIVARQDMRQSKKKERETSAPPGDDQDPSSCDDITARRAARAQARKLGATSSTRGRPLRRGVQRTRSKSLTNMVESRRGGRRNQLSKDDVNVSRRSVHGSQQLLVGFPKKAQDDSILLSRRGSTRELLRGFEPAPSVVPASPVSSMGSSEGEGSSLTTTFRNWMGTMTVMLQQPQDAGRSSQDHKIALVG